MRDRIIFIVILLLLPAALLLRLGLPVMIDDESIRALVAMEMIWQDQYIAPTLHGQWYYNKPPLYNWLLAVSFRLLGSYEEWAARVPTVLMLLGYCWTIARVTGRHLGPRIGWIIAGMFLTCGRVLMWDALLGLIDITFSWVMYGLFMVVYHQYARRRLWALFGWSYALMVVGFMLKGFPAIVFQGLTLIGWLAWHRDWRTFFHPIHFVCGLASLVALALYYVPYGQYVDLAYVFRNLFTESAKRTAAEYGWWSTVVHLFTFPVEMLYHFLPWSLVGLFALRKNIRSLLVSHPFITFCSVTFLVNLLPYWSSVEVYPRYLLMLAPLYFTTGWYLVQQAPERWQRLLTYCFGSILLLLPVAALLPMVLNRTQEVPGQYWMSALLATALSLLAYAYWRWRVQGWSILIAALLLVRIALNWYALPDRLANDTWGRPARTTSLAVGEQFSGQPLYIYGDKTYMQPTNSYYLSRAYGGVIPYRYTTPRPGAYYIYDPLAYPDFPGQVMDSVLVRHGQRWFYVAQAR